MHFYFPLLDKKTKKKREFLTRYVIITPYNRVPYYFFSLTQSVSVKLKQKIQMTRKAVKGQKRREKRVKTKTTIQMKTEKGKNPERKKRKGRQRRKTRTKAESHQLENRRGLRRLKKMIRRKSSVSLGNKPKSKRNTARNVAGQRSLLVVRWTNENGESSRPGSETFTMSTVSDANFGGFVNEK